MDLNCTIQNDFEENLCSILLHYEYPLHTRAEASMNLTMNHSGTDCSQLCCGRMNECHSDYSTQVSAPPSQRSLNVLSKTQKHVIISVGGEI